MTFIRRSLGPSGRAPSATLRVLTLVTAVTTFLLIVAGGIVRVSGSGLGCGTSQNGNDWPYCQGRLLPPWQREAVIEFSHRWLAASVSTLAVVLLVVVWARYRHLRLLAWTTTLFVGFLIVQIVLGAITVLKLLPADIIMVHLANAELLLGTTVLLTVLARRGGRLRAPSAVPLTGAQRAVSRWTLATAAAVFLLVVSGAFVVDRGAGAACSGWPLCGNGLQFDSSTLATYNLGHRIVAGAVLVLIGITASRVVRAWRPVRAVRLANAAVGVMLVLQVTAGAVLVEAHLPGWTRGLHEALASALWAAVALLAILTRPAVAEPLAAAGATDTGGDGSAAAGRLAPPRVPIGSAT